MLTEEEKAALKQKYAKIMAEKRGEVLPPESAAPVEQEHEQQQPFIPAPQSNVFMNFLKNMVEEKLWELGSMIDSATQQMSLGYSDEIEAGIRAMGEDTYEEALDKVRKEMAARKQRSPKAGITGDIAGMIAGGAGIGNLGRFGAGLATGGKGAYSSLKLPGKIARGAAEGGGAGALYGAGTEESGDRLSGAIGGGAFGAGIGGALGGASAIPFKRGANFLGDKLYPARTMARVGKKLEDSTENTLAQKIGDYLQTPSRRNVERTARIQDFESAKADKLATKNFDEYVDTFTEPAGERNAIAQRLAADRHRILADELVEGESSLLTNAKKYASPDIKRELRELIESREIEGLNQILYDLRPIVGSETPSGIRAKINATMRKSSKAYDDHLGWYGEISLKNTKALEDISKTITRHFKNDNPYVNDATKSYMVRRNAHVEETPEVDPFADELVGKSTPKTAAPQKDFYEITNKDIEEMQQGLQTGRQDYADTLKALLKDSFDKISGPNPSNDFKRYTAMLHSVTGKAGLTKLRKDVRNTKEDLSKLEALIGGAKESTKSLGKTRKNPYNKWKNSENVEERKSHQDWENLLNLKDDLNQNLLPQQKNLKEKLNLLQMEEAQRDMIEGNLVAKKLVPKSSPKTPTPTKPKQKVPGAHGSLDVEHYMLSSHRDLYEWRSSLKTRLNKSDAKAEPTEYLEDLIEKIDNELEVQKPGYFKITSDYHAGLVSRNVEEKARKWVSSSVTPQQFKLELYSEMGSESLKINNKGKEKVMNTVRGIFKDRIVSDLKSTLKTGRPNFTSLNDPEFQRKLMIVSGQPEKRFKIFKETLERVLGLYKTGTKLSAPSMSPEKIDLAEGIVNAFVQGGAYAGVGMIGLAGAGVGRGVAHTLKRGKFRGNKEERANAVMRMALKNKIPNKDQTMQKYLDSKYRIPSRVQHMIRYTPYIQGDNR